LIDAPYLLYKELADLGLSPDLLHMLPFKVESLRRYEKNAYLLRTPVQFTALWIHTGKEESLAQQLGVMAYCRERGFRGFLEPIPLNNQAEYGRLDERNWFYLTHWAELQKLRYHRTEHLRAVVRLIVDFRQTVSDREWPVNFLKGKEGPDLTGKMEEIRQYFIAYGMLARHRIHPTGFDRLFIRSLPGFLQKCDLAVERMRRTDYLTLRSDPKSHRVFINDFSRNNIGIQMPDQAVCLRLKNAHTDLAIMDLAVLLSKTGRSNRWNRQWYDAAIAEYQKVFPISRQELRIVAAYMSFPWNIYRLVSRYYLNRVNWPAYLFVEKLERILRDEKNREPFIADIGAIF
jgi:CotS family spore coat protein